MPHLRIHPLARFYDHRDEKTGAYVSWFFVALYFHFPKSNPKTSTTGDQSASSSPEKLETEPRAEHQVDFTQVIHEFASHVDQYEDREDSMDLQVDHVVAAGIPKWVRESSVVAVHRHKRVRQQSPTKTQETAPELDTSESGLSPEATDTFPDEGTPKISKPKRAKPSE